MKTPREFIENWFGSKIPEDWDLEYQPLRNVSVFQMESMLTEYAKESNLKDLLREIFEEINLADHSMELYKKVEKAIK